MITIRSEGPRLLSTNYWSTEHARRGLAYLSVNAGAFRLLLPAALVTSVLTEIAAAPLVATVITRGRLPSGAEAYEVLWDDGSDEPFSLTVDVRQADRLVPASETGRAVALALYGPGPSDESVALLRSDEAHFRCAPLPCLRPWTSSDAPVH